MKQIQIPFLAIFLSFCISPSNAQSFTQIINAPVVDVEPIIQRVSHATPRQACWQEQYTYHEHHKADSPTGAILGGIIGAAIGNELGHNKSNKRVGAVAGAVLGSSVGYDLSRKSPAKRIGHQQRCRTVYDEYEEERISGYNVTYHYGGKHYTTRMHHNPGNSLKLRVTLSPIE